MGDFGPPSNQMTNIYLKHPVHGAKVATLELEAEQDELNGWERFDPVETKQESELPAFLQEPVNELAAPKKGRPRKNQEV